MKGQKANGRAYRVKMVRIEGIKVVSFTEIDDDLEDLFMRLTKGEVA